MEDLIILGIVVLAIPFAFLSVFHKVLVNNKAIEEFGGNVKKK